MVAHLASVHRCFDRARETEERARYGSDAGAVAQRSTHAELANLRSFILSSTTVIVADDIGLSWAIEVRLLGIRLRRIRILECRWDEIRGVDLDGPALRITPTDAHRFAKAISPGYGATAVTLPADADGAVRLFPRDRAAEVLAACRNHGVTIGSGAILFGPSWRPGPAATPSTSVKRATTLFQVLCRNRLSFALLFGVLPVLLFYIFALMLIPQQLGRAFLITAIVSVGYVFLITRYWNRTVRNV